MPFTFIYCEKNWSLILGIYLFSLVTLDRQFCTFGVSFVPFGYSGLTVFYFWGLIRSLWLPWIGGFLLLGIHSLSLITQNQRFNPFRGSFALLVTQNQRFNPFRGSFALFGYPESAVNKKRIGITQFLSCHVWVIMFLFNYINAALNRIVHLKVS